MSIRIPTTNARKAIWLTALCVTITALLTIQRFLLADLSRISWLGSKEADSAFVYKGANAEDKVIVIAKMASESVDWAFDKLQDWQLAIYHMDNTSAPLHPPQNKGREAMAYLTFLIDHYHILPSIVVFLHAHEKGWPKAWHTDARNNDNVISLRGLRLAYVEEHGYANMRCIHNPGCPAEIHPFRKDPGKPAEVAFADTWMHFFGNDSAVPDQVASPCCSQFAVSKSQVLARPRSDYERYRQWLLDTELHDDVSGRVLEYLWHVIFGKSPVNCPDVQECRCEQFGIC